MYKPSGRDIIAFESENPLFELPDLIPGVGFLTSLNRHLEYNGQTGRIGEGSTGIIREGVKAPLNPDLRDMKALLSASAMTCYHLGTLGPILYKLFF
jgi:hypothetical protein